MSFSKKQSNVTQQKQQKQLKQNNTAGGNKVEISLEGSGIFLPTVISSEQQKDGWAVEALILEAYDGELSPAEVRHMAYSLEEFSRLCYHLIFGEEKQ